MPNVQAINALEPEIQKLTDDRTPRQNRRVPEAHSGAAEPVPSRQRKPDRPPIPRRRRKRKTILTAPSASKNRNTRRCRKCSTRFWSKPFAVVREAGRRVLNMRHFDVQLIGGMVLHNGKISEMKTGEGKTLVATLPVYLNALSGRGVHVVTVNDYLAKRDSEWMGKLYRFLGLTGRRDRPRSGR